MKHPTILMRDGLIVQALFEDRNTILHFYLGEKEIGRMSAANIFKYCKINDPQE